jgi:hypothetical protein
MVTKPNFLSITAIKQLVPKMLLVVGVAVMMLIIVPGRVLSGPTDPLEKAKDNSQSKTSTSTKTDSQGNVIVRTVTTGPFTHTETTTITKGPAAGYTKTNTFTNTGKQISTTEKNADGTGFTSKWDDKGGVTKTTTDKSGQVTTEKRDSSGTLLSKTAQITHPNGTVATQTLDSVTGKPTGLTLKDKNGNVTTTLPDGKGGFTAAVKSVDGKVETITYDPSGKLTGLTIKDSKGNVATALPDGKGGFTSAVTGEHGKVATSSYDVDGKLTGQTTKDKNGKVISSTTSTYDAKGGSTSVTTDRHGKVISSKVYDGSGNVVSQTGKQQKYTVGPSGQSTGGTQTSQGSGKHKDKENFQTEVFHRDKEKPTVQVSGSPGTSSGSGQQMHHKKH